MVKKYGERGHCWSLFLKACIDNGTLSVYNQEDSDTTNTAMELLKAMVAQRVSEIAELVPPCINVLPETPTSVCDIYLTHLLNLLVYNIIDCALSFC